MEAARDGDRRALEALVEASYDRVHALCRRMLGNDEDALDAAQDALLAAVRALHRFDGRSTFATWIYRIATNTCLDELRRRRRRPAVGLEQVVGVDGPPDGGRGERGRGPFAGGHGPGAALWHDPAETAAARVDVDAALASLPVEFRTAVVLRDVGDLPYEEIAAILGVPVGTVRSRIARGRAALAEHWGAPGNPGGAPDVEPGRSVAPAAPAAAPAVTAAPPPTSTEELTT